MVFVVKKLIKNLEEKYNRSFFYPPESKKGGKVRDFYKSMLRNYPRTFGLMEKFGK